MNTTYLCTLGTSIANRLPVSLLRDRQGKNLPWEEPDPEFEKPLGEFVRAIPIQGDAREKCCAETAILAKMRLSKGDRVILLATDTCLGRLCGEAVRSVLTRCHGLEPGDVSVVRIEGLQVADADRLRNVGLKNLLSTVEKAARNDLESGRAVCLCPNGGYKGVVPFLTLAGMILHCKVVYLFEFAESVIVLPPLPFALDQSAYLRARDALSSLYDRIEMPAEQFLAMVADFRPEERDRFLGFTEPGDRPGFVTISPLVGIATTGAETRTVPLSPQAAADLERLAQGGGAAVCRRLALRAQDPLYREAHTESKNVTDLVSIQRPRTAERVLGYVNGNRFLVCRVFASHDDYIRYMDKQQPRQKDFPRESFQNWTFEEESADVGENESVEEWGDLRLERDELRGKIEAAQEELSKTRRQCDEIHRARKEAAGVADDFKRRCMAAEAAQRSLLKKVESLETNLANGREECDALRSQLDEARRRAEELERETTELRQRCVLPEKRSPFYRLFARFSKKRTD